MKLFPFQDETFNFSSTSSSIWNVGAQCIRSHMKNVCATAKSKSNISLAESISYCKHKSSRESDHVNTLVGLQDEMFSLFFLSKRCWTELNWTDYQFSTESSIKREKHTSVCLNAWNEWQRKEVFKQSQSKRNLREPEWRDAHFSSIHNLVSFSRFLLRLSSFAGAFNAVLIQFSCLIWLWTNYCLLLQTQDANKRVFSWFFSFLLTMPSWRAALGVFTLLGTPDYAFFMHWKYAPGWCLFNRRHITVYDQGWSRARLGEFQRFLNDRLIIYKTLPHITRHKLFKVSQVCPQAPLIAKAFDFSVT